MWWQIPQLVGKAKVRFSSVLCALGRKKHPLSSEFFRVNTTCFVIKPWLLTSILQSNRSNAEFLSITSLFIIVGWFLRHTSRNVSRQHIKMIIPQCYYEHYVNNSCFYIILCFLFSTRRKMERQTPASRVRPTARPKDNISGDKETSQSRMYCMPLFVQCSSHKNQLL